MRLPGLELALQLREVLAARRATRAGEAVQLFSAAERPTDAQEEVGPAEHGSPVTRWRKRLGSPDGQLASGVWESSAGRHVISFDFDEWVHILEGDVNVTTAGVTRALRAGDVAFFPAHVQMTWEVPRYVRKVWVHRYRPDGVLARAARTVVRLVGGR